MKRVRLDTRAFICDCLFKQGTPGKMQQRGFDSPVNVFRGLDILTK